MTQTTENSVETESIESWFFQSTVRASECSMTPTAGKELCPSYYKTLAAAADWHAVTALFAIILVFMFVGMAVKKN